MTSPEGAAAAALADVCLRLERRREFRDEPVLLDAAAQCSEPLRVAVVGDVSTGKSTLVNALLAAKVARTRRAEETAQVTWYRRPDAGERPDLGSGHRTVPLRGDFTALYTLVDTPGTNTASQWASSTAQLLAADSPTGGAATVLIYLTRDAIVWDHARERIGRFLRLSGGRTSDKGNVVVVGTKGDAVRGASPEEVEAELAEGTGLPPERVVAVSQRLAESARCGLLTDRHLRTLREIAADESFRALVSGGHGLAPMQALWEGGAGIRPTSKSSTTCSDPSTGWGRPCRSWWRAAPPWWNWPQDSTACPGFRNLRPSLPTSARTPTCSPPVRSCGDWSGSRRTRGLERAATVRRELAELRERPEFRWLDRRAAALVLEGTAMSYVPRPEREAAAKLLRGEIAATERMRRFWQDVAQRPGRASKLRRVAETVVEAAL